MNRRTSFFWLTLLVAGLVTAAWAVIAPIRINLTASSPTYQVPAGKVLIIEQGYFDSANTSLILVFSNASSSMTIEVPGWYGTLTPIQPPLKVASNDYITALIATNDSRTSLVMFGLLVDPEDLYAAIPNQFEERIAMEGGAFRSILGLASARQPVIRLEDSTNLLEDGWAESVLAELARTTNALQYEVSLPTADEQKEFLRANVRSRVGPGGIKKN